MPIRDTDVDLVLSEFSSDEIGTIKKYRNRFHLSTYACVNNDDEPALKATLYHVIAFLSVVIPFHDVKEYVSGSVSKGMKKRLEEEESYAGQHIYGMCIGNCFMCKRIFKSLPKSALVSRTLMEMPRLSRWMRYHDGAKKWSHEILMSIIDNYESPPRCPEPTPSTSEPPPLARRKKKVSKSEEKEEPYYNPVSPPPQESSADGRTTPDYSMPGVLDVTLLDDIEELVFHSGETFPDEDFGHHRRKRRYSEVSDSD